MLLRYENLDGTEQVLKPLLAIRWFELILSEVHDLTKPRFITSLFCFLHILFSFLVDVEIDDEYIELHMLNDQCISFIIEAEVIFLCIVYLLQLLKRQEMKTSTSTSISNVAECLMTFVVVLSLLQ